MTHASDRELLDHTDLVTQFKYMYIKFILGEGEDSLYIHVKKDQRIIYSIIKSVTNFMYLVLLLHL